LLFFQVLFFSTSTLTAFIGDGPPFQCGFFLLRAMRPSRRLFFHILLPSLPSSLSPGGEPPPGSRMLGFFFCSRLPVFFSPQSLVTAGLLQRMSPCAITSKDCLNCWEHLFHEIFLPGVHCKWQGPGEFLGLFRCIEACFNRTPPLVLDRGVLPAPVFRCSVQSQKGVFFYGFFLSLPAP